MTRKELEECLLQLPLSHVEVRFMGERYDMRAFVISRDFVGRSEVFRQELLWGYLLAKLTPRQMQGFEFVYPFTPDEMAAFDRGERPVMQTKPLMTGTGG